MIEASNPIEKSPPPTKTLLLMLNSGTVIFANFLKPGDEFSNFVRTAAIISSTITLTYLVVGQSVSMEDIVKIFKPTFRISKDQE